MSKEEHKTNRDFIDNLTNEQLAYLFTDGLKVVTILDDGNEIESCITIDILIRGYTQSFLGIKDWLDKPCYYKI